MATKATTTKELIGTRAKIRDGLYHNKYISIEDLLLDPTSDYDYDPEIINNISRPAKTDRWYCYNCSWKGDKWFMMKHPCKHNKLNKSKKQVSKNGELNR